MVNPTGTKACQDILIAKMVTFTITSGISTVFGLGWVWGGYDLPKAAQSHWYYHPIIINETMLKYAGQLAVDVYYIAKAEPVAPPNYAYCHFSYGATPDDSTLAGAAQNNYQQLPIVANDYTNLVLRRKRFNLIDVFTGNEGKKFCGYFGRHPTDPLDTYAGALGYIVAYLVKKGSGE